MNDQVTKASAVNVLQGLDSIRRPEGDNENMDINHPSVYQDLSPYDQRRVDEAEPILMTYVRNNSGEPNKRSITELRKHSFEVSFNQDQYDAYRFVGRIRTENWSIDISDPETEQDD